MSKRFSVAHVDKGEITAHGFLKVPATFTRTGVFKYVDKNGNIRRELRHPDDVFHPDSLATLQHAPLTFKHPERFVTSDNIKDLQTGHIGDHFDTANGKQIKGSVLVTDKKAIAEAQKGTVELSCGYVADMVNESGIYDGEQYDCRQVNIRYNHVAQVPAGRAGPMVRMHLDSDDAMEDDGSQQTSGGEPMKKIKIKGKEFEVPSEVSEHIDSMEAMIGTKDAEIKAKDGEVKAKDAEVQTAKTEKEQAKNDAAEHKKALDTTQAELDLTKAKLSERNDAAMTPAQINQHVKHRMKIEKVASEVLGAEFKEDASDLDLMKQVVSKKNPSIKLDEKSEDYVRAGFDIVASDLGKRQDNHQDLNTRFSAPRQDGDYDVKTARQNQSTSASEAWKTPLAASKK